ncbi:hypothetical protein M0802_016575 [Mischocyttarus mexicanus]|nr:hypothetical protein M0802_016575 [Mischocyttarus mexicanus]
MSKVIVPQDLLDQGSFLIQKFNPLKHNIHIWLNRLDFLIDFLHIPKKEKVQFLLKCLGPLSYWVISKLIESRSLSEIEYEEISVLLHVSFFNGTHIDAAVFRFLFRQQFEGEKVILYYKVLKMLNHRCIGALRTTPIITYQFVKGLENKTAKNLLSQANSLTIDEAIHFVQDIENLKTQEWLEFLSGERT